MGMFEVKGQIHGQLSGVWPDGVLHQIKLKYGRRLLRLHLQCQLRTSSEPHLITRNYRAWMTGSPRRRPIERRVSSIRGARQLP